MCGRRGCGSAPLHLPRRTAELHLATTPVSRTSSRPSALVRRSSNDGLLVISGILAPCDCLRGGFRNPSARDNHSRVPPTGQRWYLFWFLRFRLAALLSFGGASGSKAQSSVQGSGVASNVVLSIMVSMLSVLPSPPALEADSASALWSRSVSGALGSCAGAAPIESKARLWSGTWSQGAGSQCDVGAVAH